MELGLIGGLIALMVAVAAILNYKINKLANHDVHYYDGKTPGFWS